MTSAGALRSRTVATGVLLAGVGLLAAVLAVVLLRSALAGPSSAAAAPAVTPPAAPTAPVAAEPAGGPVAVLNAGGAAGAAGSTAAQLRRLGWDVARVGDAPALVETTAVLYPAGADDEAAELVAALGLPDDTEALEGPSLDVLTLLVVDPPAAAAG